MIAAWAVAAAQACSCAPGGSFGVVTPLEGARGVPTSTRVVWKALEAPGAPGWLESVRVALEPPAEVGFSLEDLTIAGSGVVSLVFDDELPPDTTVTVWDALHGGTWTTFTTGDRPDREAPTLDGWSVDTTVRRTFSCAPTSGPWVSHHFAFEGLDDDHTPLDELIVHLVPRSVGRHQWASGPDVFVGHSLCGGDPTLARARHRSYDLELFDGSWNGGLVERVSTRGCDHAGAVGAGAWLGAVVVGLAARRRGPATTRRAGGVAATREALERTRGAGT